MGRRDVSQGEQLAAPQSRCGEVAKTQHKACDGSYSSPSTLCVPLPQQVSLVLGSAGISWMLNEALSDSSNGRWKFPCITPGILTHLSSYLLSSDPGAWLIALC